MKSTILDGKELQKGNKFAEVKDKKIHFYKVMDYNVSKPGKHGSSKKVIKASNLMTGRMYEQTFNGSLNVFYIDDFEYIVRPVHMVNSDFTEFHYDLENDLSLSASELDGNAKELLEFFKQKYPEKSADDLLTDDEGNRLCLIINECHLDGVDGKFLWDIQYVPEEDCDKKLSPGTLFMDFLSKVQ